jgi:DNA-binding transcriptional regulator of glucitol operon
VWRFALSRRWWLGHLLVASCAALFVWLGHWQWDRAHSPTGDWQNLGYALQWPLFAIGLIAAWARFLWLERQRGRGRGPASVPPAAQHAAARPAPAPPAPRRPMEAPTREDDIDDELAAYNAYLARLAEQERR